MVEIIFGGVLAVICLLFGTILGATLNEHATITPYSRAAGGSDTTLEQASSYATGDITIHVVEIDGRYWISTDPDLGATYIKYLGGDVHRTIQEYEDTNSGPGPE